MHNSAFACTSSVQPSFNLNDWQDWELKGYVIDEIQIQILPIFNDSGNVLARTTHRWHIDTKPQVVRRQLLIKPGEPFNNAKIRESERILRANSFFYDVTIEPVSICDERIVLLVKARDLWTLLPDVDFKRSGGDNSSRLGFRDSNFLGLGKEIGLVRKSDDQRNGLAVTYIDPNLYGSRYRLRLEYEDNSDGDFFSFDLRHPFYALSTPWSAGINIRQDDREEELFFRNIAFQEFRHEERNRSVFFGLSVHSKTDVTQRWTAGFRDQRSRFFTTDASNPDSLFPDDRHYAYPWVSWSLIQNAFITVDNLDQMTRTEDLNLGWEAELQIGYSSEAYGADDEGIVFSGTISKNLQLAIDQYISVDARFSGIDDTGLLNFKSAFETRYYNSYRHNRQFFARVRLQKNQRQFADQQLLLGGDNGLRGFPSRYQSGDRSFLLNLENRYYFNYELWQLFDTGAVVFADLGRAWFKDRGNGNNGDTLKNIGFGFRLSPTRAGKNIVLHLDFAIPLDNHHDVDDVQINFEAKRSF
ncbi:POTRA domain-containing protein [Marinicella sp. W31]|uniref:POTRA domain-containing protein n=1 Tax=Marinicella sp. W31 TaxID=3023713 RepID=UPI003757999F